ncbi:MAG TPA: isochorismatase family cysteine hydrolase [Candidatus Bathyarchaeia archaeon]|nr:isochorismatase family cysteine hydrolase [Candidatus Bathyarchaeia archaeon]
MSSLLIAIDVQSGFVTETSAHVVDLIAHTQQRFSHVVFTKFYNPDPSPFRTILNYNKMTPGSPETELVVRPEEGAVVIERPRYSCVTEEMHHYLSVRRATEAYVGGIATEACVLETAVDLLEAGIRPIIIEDLCASDKERRYHHMAIELLKKLIGPHNVIRLKDVPV